VNALLVLPVAGAFGGMAYGFAGVMARNRPDSAMRLAVSSLVWAGGSLLAVPVYFYGSYIVGALAIDMFEWSNLPAPAGRFVGDFVVGSVCGYLVATIGSLVPGTRWRFANPPHG
jgi:ABC-type antimicrobial peptide transport system permease subunit